MLPFRLRKDAKSWFRELYRDDSFKIDFDAFYFCFIAGVATGRKKNVVGDETSEMIDYYPGRYSGRGKLLVALFLTRELKELGLETSERTAVHREVARLISWNAHNHLSADGVAEFNKYAHAGYEVLLEWFDDRPRSLEIFLRLFKRKLDDTCVLP